MAERKPRQMTFRELQRAQRREEWKALMKAEGHWVYAEAFGKAAFTATDRTQTVFGISADAESKLHVYGVDALITLRMINNGTDDQIGALVGIHYKEGQGIADFFHGTSVSALRLPKTAAEAAALARYTVYRPIALSEPGAAQAGQTQSIITIPVASMLRRGRVSLLPNEDYAIILALAGETGAQINISYAGRYRAIKETIS